MPTLPASNCVYRIKKTQHMAWIQAKRLSALSLALLSTALYVAAFPPFNLAEIAWLFNLPFLLWFKRQPSYRSVVYATLGSSWLSWFILLIWLRHVTLGGLIGLSLVMALSALVWFVAARWLAPRLGQLAWLQRLVALAGLAGLWVLIEYLRTFLFTGFPWLPLAASQWNRPALLQVLAFTGFYGLSFVLIFFNRGLTEYIPKLFDAKQSPHQRRRLSPECYAALALLFLTVGILFSTPYFRQDREPLFTAGVVQPNIPQSLKWDPDAAEGNLRILNETTKQAVNLGVDLIVWPESASPYPIVLNGQKLPWLPLFTDPIDLPFLMGGMAVQNEDWYNIICGIDPDGELIEPYYAKQHLVPFGEYIPMGDTFPLLKKVVPIGSFKAGTHAEPIRLSIAGRDYRIGALVCYEDVFPALSRQAASKGIDFLFVATNNGWYGEEAGAYQHAVHSVLRAVETRRPVLRCGNGGWSGWIDAYGRVNHVLTDPNEPERGIYFRGAAALELSRDRHFVGQQSFYVRYGDWFVACCFGVMLIGLLCLRRSKKA